MGQRILNNFHKRFGDRIIVTYTDKPHLPEEQALQNKDIADAIVQVLTGILKREPTQDELLGIIEVKAPKTQIAKV